MRSFEEYWNEHGDVYGMEIAEDAWDYQQSKIDELTKQRDSFIKAYEIEIDENVGLQKRVDKAIAILSSKKKYVDMVIEVEQALKGNN